MEDFIIIIISIIILLAIYYFNQRDLVAVKSDIDEKEYFVANLSDKRKAANLISLLKRKLIEFRNKIQHDKNPEYKEYIENLVIKFDDNTLVTEGLPKKNMTSYTINKGQEIVFCIRKKNLELHDLNILLYVGIHEISHIGCPEIGHTPLFNKIFRYFLKRAIDFNIYKDDNYELNPKEYCGMTLNSYII